MKIFLYELKKVLIKQYGIFILLAVVLVRLFSSLSAPKQTFGFDTLTERENYFNLIEPFIGEVTDEKIAKINELENKLKTADKEYPELIEKHLNNEITDDEYYEQIKECNKTLNMRTQIKKAVQQVKSAEERDCDILPVSDISIISEANADYLFVLAICLICALSIITEHTSKTKFILSTTPMGGCRSMTAKIVVLLVSCAATSVLLSVIEGFLLSFQLPIQYWSYHANGIVILTDCMPELKIGELFIYTQLIKLVGSVFVASASILISELSKSYTGGIFSLVTAQIIFDYVGKRSALSYLLPTGLMRGYGYFYGEVIPDEYNSFMQFSGISIEYTIILICSTIAFSIASVLIVIFSCRNRINRKKKKHNKAFLASLMSIFISVFLCSCSNTAKPVTYDTMKRVGGTYTVLGDYNNPYSDGLKTNRYEVILGDGYEGGFSLSLKNLENEEVLSLPQNYFKNEVNTRLCLTENYILLFCLSESKLTYRYINLNDFFTEIIAEADNEAKKNLFGLTFSFERSPFEHCTEIFTNDRDFFYITDGGVYKTGVNNTETLIIDETVNNGLILDNDNIYFISEKDSIKKYNFFSGVISEIAKGERIIPLSLWGDEDHLYYTCENGEIKIKK